MAQITEVGGTKVPAKENLIQLETSLRCALTSGRNRASVKATEIEQTSLYNLVMARGWESKSVESQIESVENSNDQESSEAEVEDGDLRRRRKALQLSRSRVLQQLQVSQNPRHREMLNQALADLEAQLAELQ
jgi:hypothetical protein